MNSILWFFFIVSVFSVEGDESHYWNQWVQPSEFNLFPTLPIAAPLSEDKRCREESRKLILNLKNRTMWAAQMWDSSATTTIGALHGNKYQLGNYDECLAVNEPIRAHYCGVKIQATVHLKEAFEGNPYELDPDPNVTVWKKFQDSLRDGSKYIRNEGHWGLCVPSSCNASEMEKAINFYLKSLNKKLLETNGTTYSVEIPDNYCLNEEEKKISYDEIGFWLFTSMLLTAVTVATSLDFFKKKEGAIKEWKATRLLMTFSLKRNLRRLFISDDSPETNHLKFLHGVRCISIILIVVDHHVAILLTSAVFDRQIIEETLRSYQNMFLPHGDLVVDTFFFISGFLVSYLLLSNLQKKNLNLFVVILLRFVRLAPLYFYLLWFQASVLLRFGSGPGWKIGLNDEVEYCRKNWWTNLLFIQNYVNPKEMCMLHAWYLSCDMHFFIIAIIFIKIIQKAKKVGVIILYTLTFASILTPGIVTYIYQLQPIITFSPRFVDKPRLDISFEHLYIKSHTRAAVYFLGITTAYYLFQKRKSTWKISTINSILICLLGLGLLFAPMVYGSQYYNPRKEYNLIEATTFAIFRRLSWGLAWILFMFVNRFGVLIIFGKVFSWKISIPLSKITYGVYLIHFLIQMADAAKVRIPEQFISFDMFVRGINDLFFASGYALVLYLIIELPFKLFFQELMFSPVRKDLQLTQKEVAEKADSKFPTIYNVKL